MASLFLRALFSLLSFFTFASSLSAHTITLSMSPITTTHTTTRERLNHVASASINRSHQLKHPNAETSTIKTPLTPHSYGEHAISLSFGTPQQTLPFVMDTSSSLVWYPCVQNNVDFTESSNMSLFDPSLSSSAKVLGCTSPKCGWLANLNVNDRCHDCKANMNNCKQPCPPYFYMHGYASSFGVFFSETLRFTNKAILNDFVIGCSNTTSIWPAGVAGFGRGPASLPSQMGIKKFSYCLVSYALDEEPKISELVLHTEPNTDENDIMLQYTPFKRITEAPISEFNEYYYLSLEKITVGGVDVNVPSKFLVPHSSGHGGLVVDSTSMFTYMEKGLYNIVLQQFDMLKSPEYARAPSDIENEWGLEPCFIVPIKNSVDFPELALHFEGGAEMEVSMVEYFSYTDDQDLACMILGTSDTDDAGIPLGPSIILGQYQQQDLYMEFDLENQRLGFMEQTC